MASIDHSLFLTRKFLLFKHIGSSSEGAGQLLSSVIAWKITAPIRSSNATVAARVTSMPKHTPTGWPRSKAKPSSRHRKRKSLKAISYETELASARSVWNLHLYSRGKLVKTHLDTAILYVDANNSDICSCYEINNYVFCILSFCVVSEHFVPGVYSQKRRKVNFSHFRFRNFLFFLFFYFNLLAKAKTRVYLSERKNSKKMIT